MVATANIKNTYKLRLYSGIYPSDIVVIFGDKHVILKQSMRELHEFEAAKSTSWTIQSGHRQKPDMSDLEKGNLFKTSSHKLDITPASKNDSRLHSTE